MAQRAPPSLSRQLSTTDANQETDVPPSRSPPEAPTYVHPPSVAESIKKEPIYEETDDIVEEEEASEKDVAQQSKTVTVVQGASKGTTEEQPDRKVYGRIFPAVRKLVAMDKKDDDSVVRVSIAELLIFLISLASMLFYTFGRRSSIEYYYTRVHRALFIDTDQNGDNNKYEDITTQADFWVYMENEFLSAMYWEEWYNGDTPFPYEGYIFGESKVIGRPQLRQVRVQEGSCKVHDQFQLLVDQCYDSYSPAVAGKLPITWTVAGQNESTISNWQSEDATGFRSYQGLVSKYDGSGYVITLSDKKAETASMLAGLKEDLWIDRSTRAVFTDLNLYNANINLFLIIRLTAEFPPTGGVVVSSTFRNVKLLRYHSALDLACGAAEAVYLFSVVYFLVEMLFTGIYLGKRKMFTRFWTWYDLINFAMGLTYLGFSLKSYLDVTGSLEELVKDQSKYIDFEDLAYSAEIFREMNGINVFLTCLKIFKYLNFTKTMAELQATLSNAAWDLVGFMFMVMVVLVAYAQCGYLIFGAQLRDFSTFKDSLFTLFRIILGDFDFIGLERAHRYMGPIYFITFVFTVFFVLLNMFLAIIADTYSEVKGDGKYADEGKMFGKYFKKLGKSLRSKVSKLEKLEASLKQADTNQDNFIDMAELQKAVGKENAEQLMLKFDMSHDMRISLEEKDRMMAALIAERDKTKDMIHDAEKREEALEHGVIPSGGVTDMEEFERLSNRVHRLERSLGTIASRITTMVNKMEKIERARSRTMVQQLSKKRKEMPKTEDVNVQDNSESMEI